MPEEGSVPVPRQKAGPGLKPSGERPGIPLVLASLVLPLCLGLFITSHFLGRAADRRIRRALSGTAENIALTINPERARKLTFSREDSRRPEFRRLRDQLRTVAGIPGIGKAYTVARRPGGFFFGPEGYLDDDPAASPPGALYYAPPPELAELFRHGRSVTAGPFRDEYGLFISAFHPVFDPLTGEIILAVGVDFPAADWQNRVNLARRKPLAPFLLLLAISLVGWHAASRRKRKGDPTGPASRHSASITVLAAGLVLAVFIALLFHEADKESRRESFETLSQEMMVSLVRGVRNTARNIVMVESFISAHGRIEARSFRDFTMPLSKDRFFLAWAWLPEVPDRARGSFQAAAVRDGLAGFTIFELDENNLRVPAAGRAKYYPFHFARMAGTLPDGPAGLDLGSIPCYRRAIEEALLTGLPTSSPPRALGGLPGQPAGIIIFSPVDNGIDRGLLALVMDSHNFLLPDIIFRLEERGLAVRARHPGGSDDGITVFAGSRAEAGRDGFLSVTIPLFAFGEAYAVTFSARPEYFAAHPLRQGWLALLACALLAVSLAVITDLVVNEHSRLREKVALRTAALEEEIAGRRLAEENTRARVDELSRWHRVTLGREKRILELKEEIEALRARSGRHPGQPDQGTGAPGEGGKEG